jgi:hypothetical protein
VIDDNLHLLVTVPHIAADRRKHRQAAGATMQVTVVEGLQLWSAIAIRQAAEFYYDGAR